MAIDSYQMNPDGTMGFYDGSNLAATVPQDHPAAQWKMQQLNGYDPYASSSGVAPHAQTLSAAPAGSGMYGGSQPPQARQMSATMGVANPYAAAGGGAPQPQQMAGAPWIPPQQQNLGSTSSPYASSSGGGAPAARQMVGAGGGGSNPLREHCACSSSARWRAAIHMALLLVRLRLNR